MDVVKEIKELKNQLAYSKNFGFFFGAGTSCALGIPNIEMLTNEIEKSLKGEFDRHFKIIRDHLKTTIKGRNVNIEDILNQIRRIREITGDQNDSDFLRVGGEQAKMLDNEVCRLIHTIIETSESKADITTTKKFFAWLNILNPEYSKEIFTTNYDLVIEKSLESCHIPYFDGFVGAYEPFFLQESVEKFVNRQDLSSNWVRLWKIHGSLSWFWKLDSSKKAQRIIRAGKFDSSCVKDNELVIYPSKEKYDSSRKQPFITYFDRLKNYLVAGELFFIFAGYSFSDQHINEVILNCLRQNNRLFCIVLCYQDIEVERLNQLLDSSYLNINVLGPTKAIVNGKMEDWIFDSASVNGTEKVDLYWDSTTSRFLLGDYNKLVDFLISSSGKADFITP